MKASTIMQILYQMVHINEFCFNMLHSNFRQISQYCHTLEVCETTMPSFTTPHHYQGPENATNDLEKGKL